MSEIKTPCDVKQSGLFETSNIEDKEKVRRIIENAERMYQYVDKDLNAACRKYLLDLDEIKSQVQMITADFSSKLFKMNKNYINNTIQDLKKEQISIDSLNLDKKNPDELIAIFNDLGHYSYLGTTLENTINGIIPRIIGLLDIYTNENQVINYLYSNLYTFLTNDEIKQIFNSIKDKNK